MMRMRYLAFLVFLLFLGYVSALTPQDAMMEAWKSGNYSIVEPYLSPAMRSDIVEKTLSAVRAEMVGQYGEIRGYSLEKVERKGDYTIYYYRVTAEKGSYTVSVAVKDGRVEGFHLVPSFNPRSAIYPVLGGLLGLLLIWAYLRRFHAGELILGAVLLVPVLIIQPPLQMLPRYLGADNTAFMILWTGFVAGLVQEPLKYYLSRDKTLGRALYVGAGFGLGESLYVAVLSSVLGGSVLGLVERTLALIFHASTTVLFAYSYRNGWGRKALFAMIAVHGLIDSVAAYWHINPSMAVLVTGYGIMSAVSLVLLWKLLPAAKSENEEPPVRW